uniref:hypothetical protein n=1 Tax=Nonomuraea sp. CA-251285 TaxID=3240002 RepID=UPI003F49AAB3
MRKAQAREALHRAITGHFNASNGRADVAETLASDDGMFDAIAAKFARHCETPEQVNAVIAAVAAEVDDGMADWLTEDADSPTGWLWAEVTTELGYGTHTTAKPS